MIDIIKVTTVQGRVLYDREDREYDKPRTSFSRPDIIDICNSNITDSIRREFKRSACACWTFEEMQIFMGFVMLKCWNVKNNFVKLAPRRLPELEGIVSFQELFDRVRMDNSFVEDGLIDYIVNIRPVEYALNWSVNKRRDELTDLQSMIKEVMRVRNKYSITKLKASLMIRYPVNASDEFIEYVSDYAKVFLELDNDC